MDILANLLNTFITGLGFGAADIAGKSSDALDFMLPNPDLIANWEWLYGGMTALGLVIGTAMFGVSLIAASFNTDAKRLLQAVVGIVICAISGPAVMATYTLFRQPIITAADKIYELGTKDYFASLDSFGDTSIGLIAMTVALVTMAVAAGVLGFGMILSIMFSPIICALAVFRGGMDAVKKWARTFVGLLFAPIITSIGVTIAFMVAGQFVSWNSYAVVVAGTGLMMAATAPFVVLSRLQSLGLGEGGSQNDTASSWLSKSSSTASQHMQRRASKAAVAKVAV